MKTVSLFILATTLMSSFAFADSLPKIEGEYAVTSEGSIYCPPTIQIKTNDDSVSIYGHILAKGYQRSYTNINHKGQKVPDVSGTSLEERTTFDQNVLKTEVRRCGGFIIKTCGKWNLKHTLKIVDEKTVEIFTSGTVPSSDDAGFPIAETCQYSK